LTAVPPELHSGHEPKSAKIGFKLDGPDAAQHGLLLLGVRLPDLAEGEQPPVQGMPEEATECQVKPYAKNSSPKGVSGRRKSCDTCHRRRCLRTDRKAARQLGRKECR
jgi:hypothetical protein